MRSNRVTIADLARSLQLSTCTVSKILNRSFNGFSYSKETIQRVEEMAQKMGYAANAQARSLRTRKSMLVGFLLPSAQVSVFGALTDQLELELRNHGYQVLIVHSRNEPEAEPPLIASLLARGIDGLVWIPSQEKVDPQAAGIRPEFPAVILDRPHCTEAIPFVATDNRAAARELASRIYELGHREIGIVNAPAGDRSMRERLEGFRDQFKRGITLMEVAHDAAAAKEAVVALLKKKRRPSVVVALSETLAIGALAGLRDLELNMPGELSFASFDDFPLASHWAPRLTVVRQDVASLAASAVKLLLERMEAPAAPFEDIRLPATLEWRDSVVLREEGKAAPASGSGLGAL